MIYEAVEWKKQSDPKLTSPRWRNVPVNEAEKTFLNIHDMQKYKARYTICQLVITYSKEPPSI